MSSNTLAAEGWILKTFGHSRPVQQTIKLLPVLTDSHFIKKSEEWESFEKVILVKFA